jgi:hypothetical protein
LVLGRLAGTATSVRTIELPKEGDVSQIGYRTLYRFSVDQSYLGVEGTEIEILTGMGSSDCGYEFKNRQTLSRVRAPAPGIV